MRTSDTTQTVTRGTIFNFFLIKREFCPQMGHDVLARERPVHLTCSLWCFAYVRAPPFKEKKIKRWWHASAFGKTRPLLCVDIPPAGRAASLSLTSDLGETPSPDTSGRGSTFSLCSPSFSGSGRKYGSIRSLMLFQQNRPQAQGVHNVRTRRTFASSQVWNDNERARYEAGICAIILIPQRFLPFNFTSVGPRPLAYGIFHAIHLFGSSYW